MNLLRIASRIAFKMRIGFEHVDAEEVKRLLGSDENLADDFLYVMKKHDDFMYHLYDASGDRLSTSGAQKLKFMRSGLNDALRSAFGFIDKRFPDAVRDSKLDSYADEVFGEEILDPNTMIMKMNFWANHWHDVFTKLVYRAYELLMDERRST